MTTVPVAATLPRAEDANADVPAIAVSIHDATYHLRGTDRAYLEQLAAQVDATMRAISANGGAVDSLRVAVLAALNLADELHLEHVRCTELAIKLRTAEARLERLEGAERAARSRSASLAGLLDQVLEEPLRRAG